MEFLITRAELQVLFEIGRSHAYDLQARGRLTPPINWCGAKRFCLRTAAKELAHGNGLETPKDDVILQYWSSILQIRLARATKTASTK
jgi:hypothetical protein